MSPVIIAIACACIAALTAMCTIPPIVLLAYRKKLVDRPNYRKLQRHPVPLLGGVSVYASLVITLLLSVCFFPQYMQTGNTFIAALSISLIFMIGLLDDLIDLSAYIRIFTEIIIISCLWYSGISIDTFVGLFGISELPPYISLLLSLLTGIGLINAINLMDGVDGLVSGFGILTGIITAIFFFVHNNATYGIIAMSLVGALIPFFFCNVYSIKYKLYIGSSGSLTLGLLIYLSVCQIIHTTQLFPWDKFHISGLLAIYAIPVFDTLRVMITRILHKASPLKADKTHLHHIFVELEYPHSMITLIELSLAVIIQIIWMITANLSSLYDIRTAWNLLINVTLDAALVVGIYLYMQYLKQHRPETFARHIQMGRKLSQRTSGLTIFIRRIIDRPRHTKLPSKDDQETTTD